MAALLPGAGFSLIILLAACLWALDYFSAFGLRWCFELGRPCEQVPLRSAMPLRLHWAYEGLEFIRLPSGSHFNNSFECCRLNTRRPCQGIAAEGSASNEMWINASFQ